MRRFFVKKKRATANNKGADQPAQTRRLICAFVVRTYIKAGFLTCISSYHEKKTYAKIHNDRYKTVRGVALTRGTQYLYSKVKFFCFFNFAMWKRNKKLIIIFKPRAHPHSMKKIHATFQNDRYKSVRGVALTNDTHCLYIEDENWLNSQLGKVTKHNVAIISKPHAKKKSNNYIQTTGTSSYQEENTC